MKGDKLTKKLISILLILVSIAVIIIAFIGIYLPDLNKLKNIIPGYKLGTEVDGIIEYRFKVDDSSSEKQVYVDSNGKIRGEVLNSSSSDYEVETELEEANDTGFSIETRTIKENEDSILTKENFEKSKKLVEERLENAGATEYAIRLDDVTGEMVVELSQNDDVGYLYQVALTALGEFDIIDAQTGVVLLDKTSVSDTAVAANYSQASNSYTIYLQVNLTDEGTKLLEEISKKYVEYSDSEGNSQKEYISIRVDGASVMKTYFGEPYTQSILNVPIADNVSAKDLNTYQKSVNDVAFAINHDTMPIKYKQVGSAVFIESDMAKETMSIFYWTVVCALIVIFIILSIKYKTKGVLAGILNDALIGLIILIIKYFSCILLCHILFELFF